MKLNDPVLMGVVGAPHGVKGQLRVKSYTDDPLAIGDYGPLYTKDGRALKVTNVQPSKTVVVVSFDGIRFRDQAEALKGEKLFVERGQLPDEALEEDEFFIEDLIGLSVITTEGAPYGTVLAVPNYGAGDLVEIKQTGSAKTELFVFEAAVFPQIDIDAGRLVIVPPGEIIAQPETERDASNGDAA